MSRQPPKELAGLDTAAPRANYAALALEGPSLLTRFQGVDCESCPSVASASGPRPARLSCRAGAVDFAPLPHSVRAVADVAGAVAVRVHNHSAGAAGEPCLGHPGGAVGVFAHVA